MLGTLGIEVTPLIAGLGVGGIAAGLALRRILGDIFCSVAIVLDRPFEAGDLIQAGNDIGTVERIGVRTTRVRSLSGEQIVFPNADLIQSRLRNFQRMTERRVTFRFAVPLQTPADRLEQIPGLVGDLIRRLDSTRFEHAHLTTFGTGTYVFEGAYFVVDSDPLRALDIQQRVNLGMVRGLESLGVALV